MRELNNYLVEVEHTYVATSALDGISKVKGHRAFNKVGTFAGIYDKDNDIVWEVIVSTLLILK